MSTSPNDHFDMICDFFRDRLMSIVSDPSNPGSKITVKKLITRRMHMTPSALTNFLCGKTQNSNEKHVAMIKDLASYVFTNGINRIGEFNFSPYANSENEITGIPKIVIGRFREYFLLKGETDYDDLNVDEKVSMARIYLTPLLKTISRNGKPWKEANVKSLIRCLYYRVAGLDTKKTDGVLARDIIMCMDNAIEHLREEQNDTAENIDSQVVENVSIEVEDTPSSVKEETSDEKLVDDCQKRMLMRKIRVEIANTADAMCVFFPDLDYETVLSGYENYVSNELICEEEKTSLPA